MNLALCLQCVINIAFGIVKYCIDAFRVSIEVQAWVCGERLGFIAQIIERIYADEQGYRDYSWNDDEAYPLHNLLAFGIGCKVLKPNMNLLL